MMNLLSLLKPRARRRRFALIDTRGICRALRETRTAPGEAGWVEVTELQPHWLGQMLPIEARLVRPHAGRATNRALAA